MKSSLTICSFLTIGVLLMSILPSFLFAQNPLRTNETSGHIVERENSRKYYGNNHSQQPSTVHYGSEYPVESNNVNSASRISDAREPKRHDELMLAQYREIPKPSTEPGVQKRPSVLGSTVGGDWQNPKEIVDLVMKVSLNLFFVLSFAFGVLLLMKKWNKPKLIDGEKERVKSDSLSILQTLQIDSKISIRLVKWRSNRFLVACDQNGIQSVNPLNASFDQTLQEMEQEDSSDEQLIKKLLSGLDMARG